MSDRVHPARPLVGVATILFRGAELLVVRRGRPPLEGALSFPGGAQRLGETAEAAARRELAEETGVTAGPLVLVGHVDVIDRDPDGRVRYHYTVLDFTGEWASGEPRASDDAAAAWFERPERLALDVSHLGMLRRALAMRRGSGLCPEPHQDPGGPGPAI